MAPVTVKAAAKGGYYSAGNIGWTTPNVFVYRTAIQQLVSAAVTAVGDTVASEATSQSFTTIGAVTLTEVRVPIGKVGAPTDNLSLNLVADVANQPNGAVIQASDSVFAGTVVISSTTWLRFLFLTPVSLAAATKYWFTVERSGAADSSNYYTIRTSNTSSYAGGGRATRNTGVWGAENATSDIAFQIIAKEPQALYYVVQDTSLHILKSTDLGATWNAQDDTNAPTVTNANFPFNAVDTTQGPWLFTTYFTATNTVAVKQFDMSTDLWTAGTWGTTPPTTVSNERSIFLTTYNSFVSLAPSTMRLFFTDITDDADIGYQQIATQAGAWGGKVLLLSINSTEASLVSAIARDKAPEANNHIFYYDCLNDDFTMVSVIRGGTFSAHTDLSAVAADIETEYACATYQPYLDGSGVDTLIAAFIDAAGTIQERILTLDATVPTMAADNAVSAATTTAGRQLSTARYNSTNYIAACISGTEISYHTSTVAGTWSAATAYASGMTGCVLSQIISIDGVGLAIAYTDNGDAKFDWIVAPTSGGATRTATPVTIALQATATRTATPITAALSRSSTRSATPVTISLTTTLTRTATPITAALMATLTRSATPTIALSATPTRTATSTIALSRSATRSATPVTAALHITATRTATPATIALSATLTRSAAATIALSRTSTRTASPVTIALQTTATRTATPITAALQSTSTRTATSVTAAFQATRTRTVSPVTAALQATATRSATPITAALMATLTRSAAVTISLSGAGNTRTASPVTLALSAVLTRTASPATIALSTTGTRTATPITAALSRSSTRTATPITLALSAVLTRSAPATIALSRSSTRTASPITAALLATLTRTAAATIATSATATRSATGVTMSLSGTGTTRTASPVTIALQATKTRTATAAIALQATSTRSAAATIALNVTKTRTATPVTVALGVTRTRTALATIALQETRTRTATPLTLALGASSTLSAPADMALKATATRSAPVTIALVVIEGLQGHITFVLTHQHALTVHATAQPTIATELEHTPALVVQETSERTLTSTLTTAPALAFGLEIDES